VNSWIRVAVLTVAVGIALLSVAEPAHAATGVSANPGLGVLTVSAASGRSNVIVVERQGGDFVVRDVGDTVSAGTGCMPVSATTVRCSATGIFRISVSAGDLNDTITKTTSTPGSLIGGTGNDTLVGGANSDFLDGGSGADALLDIGGGSGAYDIELCRRNPNLRATVFDLPPVCKTATEKVGSAGFGDRIEVTPGRLPRRRRTPRRPRRRVAVHDHARLDPRAGPGDSPQVLCRTPFRWPDRDQRAAGQRRQDRATRRRPDEPEHAGRDRGPQLHPGRIRHMAATGFVDVETVWFEAPGANGAGLAANHDSLWGHFSKQHRVLAGLDHNFA
jgi:Ca2+-binding RTX toxin-like protein